MEQLEERKLKGKPANPGIYSTVQSKKTKINNNFFCLDIRACYT